MDMNTAALNACHLADDKANKNYETFGARVIEDLIHDLMMGRPVTTVRGIKVNLAFLLDGEGFISDDEAAQLITGTEDCRGDLLHEIEDRARRLVVQWVTDSDIAAAVISERVRDRVLEAEEA